MHLMSPLIFSLSSGGMDYTELINVPVIFSPGATTQSVTLTTLSDMPAEGVETLGVTLTVSDNNIDPSRIEIVVSQATVTITEDIGMYSIYSFSLTK